MRLRAIDRGLGIVAIAPFGNEENRIRTLLCGADACLPPDVTGLELAAVLQALVRRAVGLDMSDQMADGVADEPQQEAWRLVNKGWTLISPRGYSLGLTTGERDFLTRLVNAPDRKVSRDAFYPDGAEDADGAITRRRFVDVMISRLRRKARGRSSGRTGRLAPLYAGCERALLLIRYGPGGWRQAKKTRRCPEGKTPR